MINEKTTSQVIVVGSGPAGISVTWPMVRAGLQVLMVDASEDDQATGRADRKRPVEAPWGANSGNSSGVSTKPDNISPKFATPLAQTTMEGFASRNGLLTRNFFVAGSLAAGGLSKIWGALAEPFAPDEFFGFPFNAAAMAPFYAEVARRIGIPPSKSNNMERPTSLPARRIYSQYSSKPRDHQFELRAATNAVNEIVMEGREACSRCGACLYGCEGHSIYDSALELPALRRFPNFTYAPDHFVREIRSVEGTHVLDIETKKGGRLLSAKTIIMAAGTIATSHLVLRFINLIDRAVPLLSNPAAVSAFILPSFVNSECPKESFGLGQLYFRLRTDAALACGVIYGADTLPLDLFAARIPFSRPTALRLAYALAPALLMSTCYLPGEFSRNVMRVHPGSTSRKITIEGLDNPGSGPELRRVLRGLSKHLKQFGAVRVPFSTSILPAGADAHYAGVFPMGGKGVLSTTQWGELRDHPDVFLVDGSVLTRLPATHPTLTIMANADRIGHEIVRRSTVR
jgi:choline dehydrogenase-like flavoprotein